MASTVQLTTRDDTGSGSDREGRHYRPDDVDADTTKADNQAFTFIGSNAFDHHAGELQAINNGSGNWTISGDINGDGVADFQIIVHVTDEHTIAANDFHL